MAKYKKLLLLKPPERSPLSFGAFSLGVLAAVVRDITDIIILDATDWTMETTVEKVCAADPDLVGVTVMGQSSVSAGVEFLRKFSGVPDREGRLSAVPVIVGGHGATMTPEPLLQAGAAAVIYGEGETTLREIVENGISPGMAGTMVLEKGGLLKGEARSLIIPLDAINPPARDLMPVPRDGMHLMETSRGCPHQCEFCETTRFYGTRWRPLSPRRVADEVKRLLEVYNGWMIHISDDNFTVDVRRIKEICRLLIDEELIPACFMFSARADDLIRDPEALPLMAEARMLRITVGIDTLDPEVAKGVRKTVDPEIYREAFQRMREVGIFSIASLIAGLPGESDESRARAVERVIAVAPDSAQFLPYLPLPGLPRDPRHIGWEPLEEDICNAAEFTRAFFRAPSVRANLQNIAAQPGICGQMALGALKRADLREQEETRFYF